MPAAISFPTGVARATTIALAIVATPLSVGPASPDIKIFWVTGLSQLSSTKVRPSCCHVVFLAPALSQYTAMTPCSNAASGTYVIELSDTVGRIAVNFKPLGPRMPRFSALGRTPSALEVPHLRRIWTAS